MPCSTQPACHLQGCLIREASQQVAAILLRRQGLYADMLTTIRRCEADPVTVEDVVAMDAKDLQASFGVRVQP